MILATMSLMTVVVMTPQYAIAQDDINQATVFDDNDFSDQSNGASISQSEGASETAANSFDGGPSTITQEIQQNQEATVEQSNNVEDNDIVTQVNVAVEGPEIDLDDD